MAISTTTILNVGCFVATVYTLKRLLSAKSHAQPLPPGPPGLPVINNMFDWPSVNEWETFTQWAQLYGDVVHANVAGSHMIVLNSYETAMAMLHRKGAIYAGRPGLLLSSKLVGFENISSIMDEGPKWKEHRRLFVHHLGSQTALARYMPASAAHSRQFLCRILDDDARSASLYRHIRTLAAAFILDVTYGYQAHDAHDQFIRLAEHITDDISFTLRPGAHLVDLIPFLVRLPSWFPGASFKNLAAIMRRRLLDFVELPYRFTQEHMDTAGVQNSIVGSHFYNGEMSSQQHEILKWVSATMYAGGADTTVSTIHFFFLFMTLHPDIQAKAQAEIDAVVGNSRLPTISDRPHLPYVNALVSELLRLGTVLPQGAPHTVREDDMHEGYFIPKNSIIIANIWGMARDPRQYKNPHEFNPSRFLGENPELDPRAYSFGFGRRICAGRFLADNNVFMTCTMALATLSVTKAKDANGKEITPVPELHGGLITHPKEFACSIKPRSAQIEALLRASTDD